MILKDDYIKNITFSAPLNNNTSTNQYKIKMMVNSEDTFKKISFTSPMIELNINWSNLKFQIIKYIIDPLSGSNLKMYNLINELEKIGHNELKRIMVNKNKNFKFKSILNKINFNFNSNDLFIDDDETFNSYMITLKLSKNVTVYDDKSNKKTIADLGNINRNYKFLIELSELWYDNNKNLSGCNFNIVQIKYFPFYYEQDMIKPISFIPIAPPLPNNQIETIDDKTKLTLGTANNTNFTFNNINITKELDIVSRPAFAIDKSMLSSALNKLKKVN